MTYYGEGVQPRTVDMLPLAGAAQWDRVECASLDALLFVDPTFDDVRAIEALKLMAEHGAEQLVPVEDWYKGYKDGGRAQVVPYAGWVCKVSKSEYMDEELLADSLVNLGMHVALGAKEIENTALFGRRLGAPAIHAIIKPNNPFSPHGVVNTAFVMDTAVGRHVDDSTYRDLTPGTRFYLDTMKTVGYESGTVDPDDHHQNALVEFDPDTGLCIAISKFDSYLIDIAYGDGPVWLEPA